MTNADAPARPLEVFSAKVAIALFLVGVFSFSAFVTLSTFEQDLSSGVDPGAHALSRSAIGYEAAVKLARARGVSVTITRAPPRPNAAAPLVILTPRAKVTTEEIEKLADNRVLIILPKWVPVPSMTQRGWVSLAVPQSEASVADVLEDIVEKPVVTRSAAAGPILRFDSFAAEDLAAGETLQTGDIKDVQTIAAKSLVPVVTDSGGRIVVGRIRNSEEPEIYVLAEPDLLNTHGLANVATARAGMAILDAIRGPGSPIAFDVTLHGFERSRSLLRLMFEPPLLAATLCLLAAAALLAWRAATRAGPAVARKRAIALGKRTLADNSAALIRLANREWTMSRRYAALTGTIAAERIGVWRGETDETVDNLDRIGAARGVKQKFSALAAEASAAQTGADAVIAARKLHSWNEEILRATR